MCFELAGNSYCKLTEVRQAWDVGFYFMGLLAEVAARGNGGGSWMRYFIYDYFICFLVL